jgi:lipopolysaccharide export system protein LptA
MTLVLALLPLIAARAAEKDVAADASERKIEIVSDRLTTNNQERYAEFAGNVELTHQDFLLTSDVLRIYYEGDPLGGEAPGGEGEALKRLVAEGNVHIRTEEYTAQSERVEYDLQTQIIELSGENPTVTQGANTLAGKRIRLYRSEGRIEVEGSPGARVKATIVPDENQESGFGLKPRKD